MRVYVVINICLPFLHINSEVVTTGSWYCCMLIIFSQTILSPACFQVDYFNEHIMASWDYLSEAFTEVIILDPWYTHWSMSSVPRHTIPSGRVWVVVFWNLPWGMYDSINYFLCNNTCTLGIFICIIIITIRKSNCWLNPNSCACYSNFYFSRFLF